MGGFLVETSQVQEPTLQSLFYAGQLTSISFSLADADLIFVGGNPADWGIETSNGAGGVATSPTQYGAIGHSVNSTGAGMGLFCINLGRTRATALCRGYSGVSQLGGFAWGCLNGYESSQALQNWFCGLAPEDSEILDPSTFLYSFGFGKDTGDSDIFFMYNGDSGTATKIDTGFNFLACDSHLLSMIIQCAPNNAVQAQLTDLETGQTFEHLVSTTDPKICPQNTLQYFNQTANTSGQANSVSISFFKLVQTLGNLNL